MAGLKRSVFVVLRATPSHPCNHCFLLIFFINAPCIVLEEEGNVNALRERCSYGNFDIAIHAAVELYFDEHCSFLALQIKMWPEQTGSLHFIQNQTIPM